MQHEEQGTFMPQSHSILYVLIISMLSYWPSLPAGKPWYSEDAIDHMRSVHECIESLLKTKSYYARGDLLRQTEKRIRTTCTYIAVHDKAPQHAASFCLDIVEKLLKSGECYLANKITPLVFWYYRYHGATIISKDLVAIRQKITTWHLSQRGLRYLENVIVDTTTFMVEHNRSYKEIIDFLNKLSLQAAQNENLYQKHNKEYLSILFIIDHTKQYYDFCAENAKRKARRASTP